MRPAPTQTLSAPLQVIFDGNRFPAHDQGALRLLPIGIPSPKDVPFETLDPSKLLSAKVAGRKPKVFPFTVSPFILPSLINGSSAVTEPFNTLDVAGIRSDKDQTRVTMAAQQGRDLRERNEKLSIVADSVKVDSLTASPVLLPFYLFKKKTAEMTAEGEMEAEVVIPAWRNGIANLAMLKDQAKPKVLPGPTEWIVLGAQDLLNLKLFFIPRIPTPSQLEIESSKVHQEDEATRTLREAKVKQELEALGKDADFDTFSAMKKRYDELFKKDNAATVKRLDKIARDEERRDQVEVQYIEITLMSRLETMFKSAQWTNLQRKERDQFQALESSHAVNTKTPERLAGLGSYINWDSELITSITGNDGKVSESMRGAALLQSYV